MDIRLFNYWLPSIISIAVVIVGGFVTYFATITIEEQKRQYELKKEVYFGVLDGINKYIEKNYEFDNSHFENTVEYEEALSSMNELLVSHRTKVEICANKEVSDYFSDLLHAINDPDNPEKFQEFLNVRDKKLIPAMRADLMKTRKWLLWRCN